MRVHAPLNDFVWPMLEACGRVYTNCSQILLNKLDYLINLHKIHRQKFEALLCEVFGKKSTLANDQPDFQECDTANEASVPGSGERQPTSPTRNLPNVVYEPMLVLLRRWLSGIRQQANLRYF